MITNPTPQRQLRSPRPARPTQRAAATPEHQALLAARLTTRDRWLIRMLHEHRVLTTTQIAELAFPRTWAANKRLLRLHQWRVVDRFQPHAPTGTAPYHYVLDITGAHILAREEGISISDLGYRYERAVGIAYSLTLAHTVTVNGFFTALAAASRRSHAAGALTAWWSERRCARYYGGVVRPDAYGRWTATSSVEFEFFLELDWDTEPVTALSRKLTNYQRLADISGITTPVLFVFPTHDREVAARHTMLQTYAALGRPDLVPVATASFDCEPHEHRYEPDHARWLQLHQGGGRQGFSQLARTWPIRRRPQATTPNGAPPANSLPPPPPLPPPGSAGQLWR